MKYRLHESQHGFRKLRSATIHLLLFLDRIYELNDQQDVQELAVLYLDFAKAFDTVPHDILINFWNWREIAVTDIFIPQQQKGMR